MRVGAREGFAYNSGKLVNGNRFEVESNVFFSLVSKSLYQFKVLSWANSDLFFFNTQFYTSSESLALSSRQKEGLPDCTLHG